MPSCAVQSWPDHRLPGPMLDRGRAPQITPTDTHRRWGSAISGAVAGDSQPLFSRSHGPQKWALAATRLDPGRGFSRGSNTRGRLDRQGADPLLQHRIRQRVLPAASAGMDRSAWPTGKAESLIRVVVGQGGPVLQGGWGVGFGAVLYGGRGVATCLYNKAPSPLPTIPLLKVQFLRISIFSRLQRHRVSSFSSSSRQYTLPPLANACP